MPGTSLARTESTDGGIGGMTTESVGNTPRKPASRRAVVASAWLVPVASVTAAAPAIAASTAPGRDVMYAGYAGGIDYRVSPDGTRYFELDLGTRAILFTLGAEDTPAGSMLRIEWDPRIFETDPAISFDSTAATPVTTGPIGATGRVSTYVLTQPLRAAATPTDGFAVGVNLAIDLTPSSYYPVDEDVHPLVVRVTAPSGYTDPDMTNNGYTSIPRYGDV